MLHSLRLPLSNAAVERSRQPMQAVPPLGKSPMTVKSSYLTEPERKTEIGGDYDVIVLGGGPAGIAAAAAAGKARPEGAAGRALRLSRRHGHGRRRDQFLRSARQCARRHPARWCTASPTICSRASSARRLERAASGVRQDLRAGLRHGGLQDARPTSCMLSAGVEMLFHALAVGVAMESEHPPVKALLIETKSGRRAVLGRSLHRLLGRRRPRRLGRCAASKRATPKATCSIPTMMFRVERRRRGAGRRAPGGRSPS